MSVPRRIAVIASGRGSNFAAIADACAQGIIPAEPVLLLCNVEGAGALELAAQREIPARCISHSAYSSRECVSSRTPLFGNITDRY
jgi:phosphoribosylglycinamide formyltransferase-1